MCNKYMYSVRQNDHYFLLAKEMNIKHLTKDIKVMVSQLMILITQHIPWLFG